MNIFDKYCHPDIHPDDLRDLINARIRRTIRDAKRLRKGHNPPTAEEVEQDMFVTWLARDPIINWPDWLRWDVINFAADQGGPAFLVQLGKALERGKHRSRWFYDADIFILKNWRKGHKLRAIKDDDKALKILHKAGHFLSLTKYHDRIKGLRRRGAES
jgi:hypothetical protein